MSINEIINGNAKFKGGLIACVKRFLETESGYSGREREDIDRYLKLFELRASGKLMTPATWIRKFVSEHPSYKNDSVIDERINYDLVYKIFKITSGEEELGLSLGCC